MSAPLCDEKIQLMQEYQRTMELYSAAVKRLAKNMGVSKNEYVVELLAATYKNRHASIEARDQLERHIAQHGC